MKVRGGACVVLVVLVLAPTPLLAGGPEVAPTLPWWGPADFESGWSLRVPVVVSNLFPYAIDNAPVTVELDVGELARDAGWPSARVAGQPRLKSFTLDPSSVRVVEYSDFRWPRTAPDDGNILVADTGVEGDERSTIPTMVHLGFLDRPSGRPYDASANPIVALTWVAAGRMAPGASRSFMVYFDVVQNGLQPPQDATRVRESLGGLYWISRGQQIYGSGSEATVTGLFRDTTVTVFVYQGGRPVVLERPVGAGPPNPFTLDAGRVVTIPLGMVVQPFWIVASKPVLATGERMAPDGSYILRHKGFIPSADGTLRGTRFEAAMSPGTFFIYPTDSRGAVGTINNIPFRTGSTVTSAYVDSFRLSLESDRPVIVQGQPELTRVQFVDLSGAPIGDHLVGTPYGSYFNPDARGGPARWTVAGGLQIASFDESVAVVGRNTLSGGRVILPTSVGGSRASALSLTAGEWVTVLQQDDWGFEPVKLATVDPLDPSTPDADVRVMAIGGPPTDFKTAGVPPTPLVSPIGGDMARHFRSTVAANVFAFHNGTLVDVEWANGTARTLLLSTGARVLLKASDISPMVLRSDKPIAVVPTDFVAYGAARLKSPSTQAGVFQYRGYLVSLAPAGGEEEPMVRTAAFGETVHFNLTVTNLGRGIGGGNLPDTIRIGIPPIPPGWNVTVEPREVTLESGASADIQLTVRTPSTRGPGDRLQLTVEAVSGGNPRMRVGVETITLLRERRGVGIWYEEVGGPRELLLRFNPAEERVVPVVVKNLGSSRDSFKVVLSGSQAGWSASVLKAGEPVASVSLDAGAVSTVDLLVRAPALGLILPTSFAVTAVSLNDTTTADKVLFDGLVLAQSKIGLSIEPDILKVRPGEVARFDVKLRNDGNASADVQLNATTHIPASWQPPEFTYRDQSLAPVGNRLTNVPPTGSTPIHLALTLPIPPGAPGGFQFKILVTAAPQGGTGDRPVSVPLNVFVEPIVDLRVSPPPEPVVVPGSVASLNFTVGNAGNINGTIHVQPIQVAKDWVVTSPASIEIQAGRQVGMEVGVGVPPGTASGNRSLELRFTLPNGTSTVFSVPVRVPSMGILRAGAVPERGIVPGVSTNITIPVWNPGNAPATAAVVPTVVPRGWTVAAVPRPPVLQPLESGRIRLEIVPARDQPDGPVVLPLGLEGSGAPVWTNVSVHSVRPDLAVSDIVFVPSTSRATPSIVQGIVSNAADVVVDNATISIQSAGSELSSVVVSKVPAGGSRVFSMELPGDVDSTTLSVVVDPRDRLPESDESNNRALVAASQAGVDPLPGPGAPLLAVIAAFAALLWAGRTRRHRE